MPRILNGYWCAGVGGGIASVGHVGVVAPLAQWMNSGGTCWLAPGLALFQNGAHLESFDLSNGEHNENVDSQGAYALAANGHVYAALFSDGVRRSDLPGQRFPGGIGDVAPDGWVLLKTPDGLTNGVLLADVQALSRDVYVGLDANFRPFAHGTTAPVALPGHVYTLRVKGDLCLYHAEQGGLLILQQRDVFWGVILASGLTECYRADFEEQPDGSIPVMYATKESEAPGELVMLKATRGMFAPITPQPAPPPIILPSPIPAPTPAPSPEPTPVSFPNHIDVVQRIRAQYPASLTAEQCFAVTNAVAADPAVAADGWGLTKAPAGGEGVIVNGQNYRLDKLCHPSGFINDILGGTPGPASAQWGPNADANGNASNWAPPVGVSAPPPQQPPPSPFDPSALLAQIAALGARVKALESKPDPVVPPLPDLSQFAKHGDAVKVTGHVTTYGLRSADATWDGKIQ